MILFLAGSIFGQIDDFFKQVKEIEEELSVKADTILQNGNMGIYPDINNIDRNMRNHSGPGDFSKYYHEQTPMPRPTIFIPGKSEDHRWMELMLSKGRTELLPGLTWLVNGYSANIGFGEDECTILSLGKLFSPNTFYGARGHKKKKLSHFTRGEVERACSVGPVDIFLSHEPPTTKGVDSVIYATRPKLIVHSMCSYSQKKEISTPTISLGHGDIMPIEWKNGDFSMLS
jgi:hypothetical protein